MVNVKANRIPEFRRILPFINETRLIAFHQLCYVNRRLRKIAISPNRIGHVENAFRMLLASRSLATPFWPFNKDCACPL